MTDQQCADAMSVAGNPYLHTPAMDELARRGVRFTGAYSPQPLCMPCRSSMQTGRFPHEINAETNVGEIPAGVDMLGALLRDASYDPVYFGKWHVAVSPEDHKRHGYRILKGGKDNELADKLANYLDAAPDQPRFMTLSFTNPHDVCQLARREPLPQGAIPTPPEPSQCPPLPDNFAVPADEPSAIREAQRRCPEFQYPTLDWREADWRQYLWGYYRLVEMVDREIGRALDVLRERGELDATVIVFLSDHGEGVANHRWNQKQVLYEAAAHVPFIVVWPGVTDGQCCDEPVSIGTDLLPTLVAFADARLPSGLSGESLLPLLREPSAQLSRDCVFAETAFTRGGEPYGINGRMARSRTHKYVVYSCGENREQLFDMAADPGECRNLAADAGHHELLHTHRRALLDWGARTADDFPYCPV